MSQEPTPRRFAIWAAALLLPLVLAVAAFPWIKRQLGPAGGAGPVAQAAGAARAAEGAAAAQVRRADAALGGGTPGEPPAPRRPEGPTTEQLEAARAADEAVARAQRGWQKVEVLAPRQAKADADGELVAPFQGFGLSIESAPEGATVWVAGRDVGETPLLTSVACQPGAPVEVRVEKRPLRPQVRTVRCRADALVTVRVALAR